MSLVVSLGLLSFDYCTDHKRFFCIVRRQEIETKKTHSADVPSAPGVIVLVVVAALREHVLVMVVHPVSHGVSCAVGDGHQQVEEDEVGSHFPQHLLHLHFLEPAKQQLDVQDCTI